MMTQAIAQEVEHIRGLHTVTALTHRQIMELVDRKIIQAELFELFAFG
jgi:hypothetical protein